MAPLALMSYIFAGGFTLGVRQHFKIKTVLEGDGGYGVPTAKLNFPGLDFHYGPNQWPIEKLKKEPIDAIFGNPPCAAWSANNQNSHNPSAWRTDPRVDCTRHHFGLLEALRPKIWAWESVTQAPSKGAELVAELTEKAMAIGYSVTQLFHDAQWLGVPQVRKRWFLVAHRVAFEPVVPNWAPPTTVAEALDSIVPRGGQAYDAPSLLSFPLHLVKPGQRICDVWEKHVCPVENQTLNTQGHIKGRPSFGYKRLRADQPSYGTVGYGMIHPTEDRFLSVNEIAVLAGYPEDYQFIGTLSGTAQIDLIARGVCPPVAEWLARAAATACRVGKPVEKPVSRVIDFREPPDQRRNTMSKAPIDLPRVQALAPPPPAPPAGSGSGAYIRSLLTAGYTTEGILAAVHAHFPGSKATKSDVNWNKQKLKTTAADGLVKVKSAKPVMPWEADKPSPEVDKALSAIHAGDAPRQPTRAKALPAHVDPDRKFDHTALTWKTHGGLVHRDYAAHFFRWGFAGRFIGQDVEVLDVGCGIDTPLLRVLKLPMSNVPKRYVGVDFNPEPEKFPHRTYAQFHWGADFVKLHKKLGVFDLVVNFEVIEHMSAENGLKLLKAMKACLKPGGQILLSTPVFNGKAAANHIHEYTIPELEAAVKKAGLQIIQRFGTFASWPDLKRVATKEHLALVKSLSAYYSGEVISCFLAPLYPDAARNNVWLLK